MWKEAAISKLRYHPGKVWRDCGKPHTHARAHAREKKKLVITVGAPAKIQMDISQIQITNITTDSTCLLLCSVRSLYSLPYCFHKCSGSVFSSQLDKTN
jgi:tRNA A37 threonylcarbamoyladenosine dehydratase